MMMPKLWSDTIDAHRQEVRDAITETTVSLVAQEGVRAVTMSRIAEEVGIGRATLYKYFPDVDSILHAWHEQHVSAHLGQLREIVHGEGSVDERLGAVLHGYALIRYEMTHQAHGADLTALLHQHGGVAGTEEHLRQFLTRLLTEAVAAGCVRTDISAAELATFCLHALSGAGLLSSKAAVSRLVTVTVDGLRGGPSNS
jgi:AcrR family transcriptional regulator